MRTCKVSSLVITNRSFPIRKGRTELSGKISGKCG